MTKSYKYKAFGLKIESVFPIPELPSGGFRTADVKINFGENPNKLSEFTEQGVLYQAKKDDFLFRLDTVGSYRVKEGRTITVERLNNATDEEVRLFLLGSAFGALIHQHGLLPLHGSTVIHKEKAITICGVSGAGKSTLAAVLQKRGFSILADDITAIEMKDNVPVAYAGIPHLKLWEDVIKKLKEDPAEYERVRPRLRKYRKYAALEKPADSIQLQSVILLTSHNKPEFNCKEIKGAEKFNALKNNTYRPQFITGLETTANHFRLTSQLAANIYLFRIERPNSPLLIDELADFFIENILQA